MPMLTQDRVMAHHMRMVGAGFLVGSLIALPAAVIGSGRLSSSGGTVAETAVTTREVSLAADVKAQPKIASDEGPATLAPTPAPAPVVAVASEPVLASRSVKTERIDPKPDPVEVARRALEERIETARTLLKKGDVLRAREILAKDDASPAAAFVLAEAFDPNVLASLNLVGVRSEVERARQLYARALSGGVTVAQQRLDSLQ